MTVSRIVLVLAALQATGSTILAAAYADWQTVSVIPGQQPTATGSVDGVPFNVTFGSTNGEGFDSGPAISTLGPYDQAPYTPVGPGSAEELALGVRMNNDGSGAVSVSVFFDEPLEDLRVHVRGLDATAIQFLLPSSEQIASGGTEFITQTLQGLGELSYDSDPSTQGDPLRDGYGTFTFNNFPWTSMSFRYRDNPLSTEPIDATGFTFSARRIIPEPTAAVLVGVLLISLRGGWGRRGR